jgi:fluoride exporter
LLAVMAVFWVALGSALGGVGRYWCSGLVARRFGERFPWGTLFVNVAGSLLVGIFAGLGPDGLGTTGPSVGQFVMTGICGGYTTFSSFSLQTLNLAHDRQWAAAAGNILLSTLLCLGAVWVGFTAALALGRLEGH